MRVGGGRLRHAVMLRSQRHLTLLPRNDHITRFMIQNEHLKHWHAVVQATMNAVRQNYWPICGRNLTRIVVHQCVSHMPQIKATHSKL